MQKLTKTFPYGVDNITVFILLLLFPFQGISQISFIETANANAIEHLLGESGIGAGVSFYDFNNDGLDDLSLATEYGKTVSFYLNTGSAFQKIEPLVDNIENIKQILWADFDNDGDADLYLAAYGGINRLYKNLGSTQAVEVRTAFEDITRVSGLPEIPHFGYGAVWGDYNRDGWLDLYYASRGSIGFGDAENRNRLFKNNADGSFTEVTESSNAADPQKIPFCSLFLDYNNDNWPDIYTANDKLTGNTLLRNLKNGSFTDVSQATGAGIHINAMCVNAADVNKDGWTDIYVTNTPSGNRFLLNKGARETSSELGFKEQAEALGIGFYGNGWGSNFLDADNDGDLDLYVSGSIGGSDAISSVFYENMEDQYFEIPSIEGFRKDTTHSFSNAIGDFNNDGLTDIMVNNNPPYQFHLWENTSSKDNNWVKIKLEGVLSNRDGIGTKIESYCGALYQSRYTHCGFGFLGQNSSQVSIGLASYESIDSLIITWPSGHLDKYYDSPVNQLHYLKEGASTNGEILVDEEVSIKDRLLPTATKEIKADIGIILSPNPGFNRLLIESKKSIKKIAFFDLRGVQQLSQQFEAKKTLSFSQNTQHWPSGLYLIKIWTEDKFRVLKWVKSYN